jgi:outer membrane immunogenic protein
VIARLPLGNIAMKKFALTALALLGLTDLSLAADLPVKAPPMAAPVFTWTGFYVGGNAGWGWGQSVSTAFIGDLAFPTGTVFNEIHSSGFLGGAQAGFNYQTAYNLVVGVEGEWDWTNISGTETTISSVPGFVGRSSTTTGRIKDIADLTGRVGFAAGNWLFYGKGGVALDQTSSSGFALTPTGTLVDTHTSSTDRSGWIAGAGIEWGFAPGWSAKIEYEHFDLGTTQIGISHIAAATGAFTQTFVNSTEKIDVVKGGINYRFNWGAPGY